ncbi:DNA polymerase III subunit gamma and tau [Actinomycetaceae bacterium MB13-C1-2]|nr:DNA polymerase III subunit gamma and tau [Actinomycetaceae bacterium MB13-C1-2]
MTTALYRRYRPDTFQDVIGQEHVTTALQNALSSGRIAHAFLFSGPRGCGKTTSARILARSLNCAEGPTPTPCGKCESCIELASGGPGSLDVMEIDAASNSGVDDARSLRERAEFAPSRDRYRIFILDEAHMVTSHGFNALLKLVEEPPEHVKFIFATTEPDKVISTIRSRTHHYPFRLVPPNVLMPYLRKICVQEKVTIDEAALPLVVRAGGGSVRDSLSVLDQLIAGSDGNVTLEQATHLLGFTDAALLDRMVEALGVGDGAGAFSVVEEVVGGGHEPRRFAQDLLQRLRDMIVAALAGPERSQDILLGVPSDQLATMLSQAERWGTKLMSRRADLVEEALREMTGATAPRLQLELLIARLLVEQPSGESGATVPVATYVSPVESTPTSSKKSGVRSTPGPANPSISPRRDNHSVSLQTDGHSSDPSSARVGKSSTPDPVTPSVTTSGSTPMSEVPAAENAGSSHGPSTASLSTSRDVRPSGSVPTEEPQVAVTSASTEIKESSVQNTGPEATAPQQSPAASSQESESRSTPSAPPKASGSSAEDVAPSEDEVRSQWRPLLSAMGARSALYGSLLGATRGVGSVGGTVRFTFAEEGYVRRFKNMKGEQDLGEVLSEIFGMHLTAEVGTAEQLAGKTTVEEVSPGSSKPESIPATAESIGTQSGGSHSSDPSDKSPESADLPDYSDEDEPPIDESSMESSAEEPPTANSASLDATYPEHDLSSGSGDASSLRSEVRGEPGGTNSNPSATTEMPENEINEARYRGMPATERVLNILGGQIIDEVFEQAEDE